MDGEAKAGLKRLQGSEGLFEGRERVQLQGEISGEDQMRSFTNSRCTAVKCRSGLQAASLKWAICHRQDKLPWSWSLRTEVVVLYQAHAK
jgi:hypothetical protein